MFRFPKVLVGIILAMTLVLSVSSVIQAQDVTPEPTFVYRNSAFLFEYDGDVYAWEYTSGHLVNFTNNVKAPASKPRWGGIYDQLVTFEVEAGKLRDGQIFKTIAYTSIFDREPYYVEMCKTGQYLCSNAQINSISSLMAFSAIDRVNGMPIEFAYNMLNGQNTIIQADNFLPNGYANGWTGENVFALVGMFEGDKIVRRSFTLDGTINFVDDDQIDKPITDYKGCNGETITISTKDPDWPTFNVYYANGALALTQAGTPAAGNPWRACDVGSIN